MVALLLLGTAPLLYARTRVPGPEALATLPLDRLLALSRQHPESEPVYYALGDRLRREGRIFEAVTAFEQAATNDPRCARSVEAIGVTLASSGQWEDAAEYLTWCLRIDPNLLSAHRELGLVSRRTGAWDTAAREFKYVSERQPPDGETLFLLGESLGHTGRRSDALIALQQAVGLAPQDAPYRGDLERALRQASGVSP